jgi:hypothetical protein
MFFTPREAIFLANIKHKVEAGEQVDAYDKQQVVDLMARNNLAMPIELHSAAADQGVDTSRLAVGELV